MMQYPGCWHIAVDSDIRARSEQLVLTRRNLELAHAANPATSGFDPLMPWNSAYQFMTKDMALWDKVFEKPALRYQLELQGRAPSVPAFSVTGGLAGGAGHAQALPHALAK